jgi:hypothetical protein
MPVRADAAGSAKHGGTEKAQKALSASSDTVAKPITPAIYTNAQGQVTGRQLNLQA